MPHRTTFSSVGFSSILHQASANAPNAFKESMRAHLYNFLTCNYYQRAIFRGRATCWGDLQSRWSCSPPTCRLVNPSLRTSDPMTLRCPQRASISGPRIVAHSSRATDGANGNNGYRRGLLRALWHERCSAVDSRIVGCNAPTQRKGLRCTKKVYRARPHCWRQTAEGGQGRVARCECTFE